MDAVARATHLSSCMSPLSALLWLPVYLYRLSLPVPMCFLSTWPLPMLCHYYALHPGCVDCISVRRRPTLAEAARQRAAAHQNTSTTPQLNVHVLHAHMPGQQRRTVGKRDDAGKRAAATSRKAKKKARRVGGGKPQTESNINDLESDRSAGH